MSNYIKIQNFNKNSPINLKNANIPKKVSN